MAGKSTRATSLAKAISKITNPCILSVLMLLVVALTESSNAGDLVIWGVIILLFFVLIPLVYLYIKTSRAGNHIKSVFDLTLFLKQHPATILILAGLLGIPCLVVLWLINAPVILISVLVALVASSIIIALINFSYRVSFHLAAITLLVIMAAQTWGETFLAFLAIIPPIAWAKFYIRDHTVPQLIIGIALGVIISLAVSYFIS